MEFGIFGPLKWHNHDCGVNMNSYILLSLATSMYWVNCRVNVLFWSCSMGSNLCIPTRRLNSGLHCFILRSLQEWPSWSSCQRQAALHPPFLSHTSHTFKTTPTPSLRILRSFGSSHGVPRWAHIPSLHLFRTGSSIFSPSAFVQTQKILPTFWSALTDSCLFSSDRHIIWLREIL